MENLNGSIETLSDIISSNNISLFDTLKDKFKDSEVFKYMLLKNWVKENCDILNDVPGKIKTLLEQSKEKKKCKSVMYDYLNNVVINCNLLSKIYEGWDRDIKDFNAKTKWKECLNLTDKATTNKNLRLIQYKLMTRIYYSRDKIHKFDASSPPICLKCGSSDSLISLMHFGTVKK